MPPLHPHRRKSNDRDQDIDIEDIQRRLRELEQTVGIIWRNFVTKVILDDVLESIADLRRRVEGLEDLQRSNIIKFNRDKGWDAMNEGTSSGGVHD